MKRAFVFHPFLLAAYPPLFLLSHNMNRLSIFHIVATTAVIELFTFLPWLLLNFVFKSKAKAGLLVSLFLAWFFFYGNFFEAGEGLVLAGVLIWRHKYIFSIWIIIFGLAAFFVIKRRGNINNLTNIVNIFSALLIIFCFYDIGIYKLKNEFQIKPIFKEIKKVESIEIRKVNVDKSSILPDIYYIILDGYASYDVLKKYYDFDNKEFYNYLTKKGFYIANDSLTNYNNTRFSLVSSLNMNYIQDLFDEREELKNPPLYPYHRLTLDNKVISILKSKGYKYICLGFPNKYADLNLFYGKSNEENEDSEFLGYFSKNLLSRYLLQMTFLSYLVPSLVDISLDSNYIRGILYCFDELSKINEIKGPKFIFAHILSTHFPFVFGPNGEKNTLIQSLKMGTRQLYTRQLIYMNKRLEKLIDVILSQSKVSPIIVLQADHGCRLDTPDFIFDSQFLEERFHIFNAYYLPDEHKDILYDSVTPVNTFRIILTHYFSSDYELLKDESYLYANHKFINITRKVRHIENRD